jgi:hypothetical protein
MMFLDKFEVGVAHCGGQMVLGVKQSKFVSKTGHSHFANYSGFSIKAYLNTPG